jgi:hypothetical protein
MQERMQQSENDIQMLGHVVKGLHDALKQEREEKKQKVGFLQD